MLHLRDVMSFLFFIQLNLLIFFFTKGRRVQLCAYSRAIL